MKKYSLYLLLILSVFTACSKKDDTRIFDESPDERLNKVLLDYQTQLTGAANGWKAIISPASGGAYSFYFKFNDQNRVSMVADFDSASAGTPKESSYRLKALQQPSLIFDTYSYLHLLSDPDPSVSGGVLGGGLLSDFEFYFDSTSTDTIRLVGRVNGSKAVLVRATQQEASAYTGGQILNTILQLKNISKIVYYFKRLTIGGRQYDVNINENTRTITFTWTNSNGTIQTFTTTYYYSATGIVFLTPFNDGTQTIAGFDQVNWNSQTNSISVTAGSNAGIIAGVNTPIAVDKGAPDRWWSYAVNNGNGYWISPEGFHVNGVDNAFQIDTITGGSDPYYYLLYWPSYQSGIDLLAPVFFHAADTSVNLYYGTAPRSPNFTVDGRAIFREAGSFGDYPVSGAAALTRDQLYTAGGYYFVQTSETTYDMVSVADSRIWISWLWPG